MTFYKPLLGLIILFLPSVGAAQVVEPVKARKTRNQGVFNITQLGYNRGFGDVRLRNDILVSNRGYVVRLRTTFGYFLNPSFSLGVGFGLDGYHKPGYNTAPLVLDLRYYLNPQHNTLFFNANTGYSLKLGELFEQGMYNSINAGYRYILGRRMHILLSTGLDFYQIQNGRTRVVTPSGVSSIETTFWLKSVSFNVGLLF